MSRFCLPIFALVGGLAAAAEGPPASLCGTFPGLSSLELAQHHANSSLDGIGRRFLRAPPQIEVFGDVATLDRGHVSNDH